MLLGVVLPLFFVVTFVPILALLYGISRWQSDTGKIRRKLEATRRAIATRTFDPEEIRELPEPVRRYFQAVLAPGQPIVAVAEIGQSGEMRPSLEKTKWVRFTADQVTLTERPGFHWAGRLRRAPGAQIFVHDSYIAGEGALNAALFALLPAAKLKDEGGLAKAELTRFLAEAPWYPTKLLPSQGVTWTPIDDSSALATLVDDDIQASVTFSFDEGGMIQSARAEARARMERGGLVETPWECRYWGYGPRTGMHIPLEAEAAWILPDGKQPYWRGQITDALYKFAS